MLASRRRTALVLLDRGLRNRKTIDRAICPIPIRMDGAPRAQGLGERREQQILFGDDTQKSRRSLCRLWRRVGMWRRSLGSVGAGMPVVFRVMRDGCFRDDPPLALLPDYEGFEVEKRISPLRSSQMGEQLRSKSRLPGWGTREQTTAEARWMGATLVVVGAIWAGFCFECSFH